MPKTDVLILGATPGGIMAALAAADDGVRSTILERTAYIGGLPANGLGATDIGTRGATAGLFTKFTEAVRQYYVTTYGADSQQVQDCSDGYHFEPSVATAIFTEFLSAQPLVTVRLLEQIDVEANPVEMQASRPVAITSNNRTTGEKTRWEATVFIDATYEGDLAAACGAPFRLGREGRNEYQEAVAGPIYQPWRGKVEVTADGKGDHRVQAYNYRLCLTDDAQNRVAIERPASYNAAEFESLIDDVKHQVWAGQAGGELHKLGIGRLTNMVVLPNRKTDANNQHLAYISTDLPEENQDWPIATWAWRDAFAQRLREYITGLIWFAQHDPRVPEDFRTACLQWGWAANEYQDNGHFPRQVYVREGRRIEGDHLFTAHDALPVAPGARPPLHADSITASHYALDSHACRKREPGKPHLEGFLSTGCAPYTVPYGVMVPKRVEWLLAPVPASATHIGFSTLRMEPCWMALGEAAGVAAALAVRTGIAPRSLPLALVQQRLIQRGAVLVYFKDVTTAHPAFAAIQRLGLLGACAAWEFQGDAMVADADAQQWWTLSGHRGSAPRGITRTECAQRCFPVVAAQVAN